MSENKPVRAAFRLNSYHFTKAELNFTETDNDEDINMEFIPRGILDLSKNQYKVFLEFTASTPELDIIKISMDADFDFIEKLSSIEDVPAFFYPNSIAIVFPYIRAFISTLSLQANYNPLIIPTMNLGSLAEPLKANTEINK